MAFLRYFRAKLPQPLTNRTDEMWDRLINFLPELGYDFAGQDRGFLRYDRGDLHGNMFSFNPRHLQSWLIVSLTDRGITYRFIADCRYQYISPWEETVWLFELDQIAEYVATGNRLIEQSQQLAQERRWAMVKYYATMCMTSYRLPVRWHHLYSGKIIRREYYLSLPRRKRPKLKLAA